MAISVSKADVKGFCHRKQSWFLPGGGVFAILFSPLSERMDCYFNPQFEALLASNLAPYDNSQKHTLYDSPVLLLLHHVLYGFLHEHLKSSRMSII